MVEKGYKIRWNTLSLGFSRWNNGPRNLSLNAKSASITANITSSAHWSGINQLKQFHPEKWRQRKRQKHQNHPVLSATYQINELHLAFWGYKEHRFEDRMRFVPRIKFLDWRGKWFLGIDIVDFVVVRLNYWCQGKVHWKNQSMMDVHRKWAPSSDKYIVVLWGVEKSLQLNVKTALILKDAESCALYNPLNKGNIAILLRF